MQVIKYVLYLRLCGGGCVSNILGIGPGLVSMSPLLSNINVFVKCVVIRLGVMFKVCGL